MCDGAAALVVTTQEKAKNKGLPTLGRVINWASWGCDPKRMGLGPVGAIQKALNRAGMKLEEMDLIEVNEAFAAQY